MACKANCRLCRRLIISQSVTFADGTLTVNIPAGAYEAGCKYCLVIAQSIPTAATIAAPVVITIGTQTYPLTTANCAQVTACGIRTRHRYSTVVSTSATGGAFRMLGRPACSPDYSRAAIDGTAPTEGGATT